MEKEFDDFYEDQVHKSAGNNFLSILNSNTEKNKKNIITIINITIWCFQVLWSSYPKCLACCRQYGRKKNLKVNANHISTSTLLSSLLVLNNSINITNTRILEFNIFCWPNALKVWLILNRMGWISCHYRTTDWKDWSISWGYSRFIWWNEWNE